MNKQHIINQLKLELHPIEGGYFKRTYESDVTFNEGNKQRKLLTSIYYMLTDDNPIGYMHRNKSDIIHYYHLGASMHYTIISPTGTIEKKTLGPNIDKGECLQLTVKGGDWKASRLEAGEYSLISEAVSPGFEYTDNEIASLQSIEKINPNWVAALEEYIKLD